MVTGTLAGTRAGPVVASIVPAFPAPTFDQQALWDGHFAEVYGHNRLAARIWQSTGVRGRHGVVDPREEDVSDWGTEARMRRFVQEATPLGKEAVSGALAAAGVAAADVGLFVVASCTGYATPGLDITLARDLSMDASTQRLAVGHMGCYAALPALGAAADYVIARGRPAAVLCCELTSLHLQRPSPAMRSGRLASADLEQVVTHSLFADAAAAAVVVPGAESGVPSGPGREARVALELVDITARTDAATADHMSWEITDQGFRMGLSPRVPDVLARHLRPAVDEMLRQHGLVTSDVAAWAAHPGGPRILEVAADALDLDESGLAASYEVLREKGNCSSTTVLLVLDRIVAAGMLSPGDHVVMLAFGPGLTLYAALLRAV